MVKSWLLSNIAPPPLPHMNRRRTFMNYLKGLCLPTLTLERAGGWPLIARNGCLVCLFSGSNGTKNTKNFRCKEYQNMVQAICLYATSHKTVREITMNRNVHQLVGYLSATSEFLRNAAVLSKRIFLGRISRRFSTQHLIALSAVLLLETALAMAQ